MTSPASPVAAADRPGLIWGVDFLADGARPVDDIELLRDRPGAGGFRWLHLNLSDRRTQRWIASAAPLPAPVRDLLLSADGHQRAIAADGVAAFVLQDIERDFDDGEARVGLLRFAAAPTLMITARYHPLRSADIVRQRISGGSQVGDATAAIELMLTAMAESVRRAVAELDATVQAVEDALLKDGRTPDARAFVIMRSLMVRLHRMHSGARAVLLSLAEGEGFTAALVAVAARAADRLAALDGELLSIQSQLRLLREELDLQATQRTNQNLYILSILTALMMPATLVTGIFGMNTGGLPWAQARGGTLMATALAFGSALAVYVALRLMGFIRR